MTELNQVYKCQMCGNIVTVLHTGAGKLVCCGKPMDLVAAKTADAGREKHVPVIAVDGDKVTVKVGEIAHPMEDKHHIEWIELTAGGVVSRRFLNPGEVPEVVFPGAAAGPLRARSYCNLHGLWEAKR